MIGKIKWYNFDMDIGFIVDVDNLLTGFFRRSDVLNNSILQDGQNVEFELTIDTNCIDKLKAVNIRPLE